MHGADGCGVAPLGISGAGAAPPVVSPPPGHPRGGRRPPLNLFRGSAMGRSPYDQFLSKIFLKNFLGADFVIFFRIFAPLWENLAPPERGGGEKSRFARAKTFNFEVSPTPGEILCTRLPVPYFKSVENPVFRYIS